MTFDDSLSGLVTSYYLYTEAHPAIESDITSLTTQPCSLLQIKRSHLEILICSISEFHLGKTQDEVI